MDGVEQLVKVPAAAGNVTVPTALRWAALRERCRSKPSTRRRRLTRKLANQLGGRRQVALNRLSSAICRLSMEVESKQSDTASAELVLWLLEEAAERLERREVNEGWASFNSAHRASYALASEEERRVLASSLRAEIGQKLTGWRQDAALEALRVRSQDHDGRSPALVNDMVVASIAEDRVLTTAGINSLVQKARIGRTRSRLDARRVKTVHAAPATLASTGVPTSEQLQIAQSHLDERSTNVYRRLDLYAKVLYFFLWSLVAVLVALYFAVRESWVSLTPVSSPVLKSTGSLVSIMLLGALGSLLSAALTRVTPGQARIPELIEGWLGALLRPVLGAASALALVIIIESGMLSAAAGGEDRIIVWAIVAGFSERLLRRSIESIAASAETARSPTEVDTSGTPPSRPSA